MVKDQSFTFAFEREGLFIDLELTLAKQGGAKVVGELAEDLSALSK